MVVPLAVSLAIAICLSQVATFSTTIYLHRSATHRALTLHPAVVWLSRFALWITTGVSTKEWVAVHRKHHAFTDEDGDPHSPRLKGFWPVQLGNVFYYVFFLSSSINGLCHSRGHRTFDNTATNIRWLALLTGGEGFHNNHHGFPRSPKFSVGSGEIDPSWPIIRLLTRLKLARPLRTIEEAGHALPALGEARHGTR